MHPASNHLTNHYFYCLLQYSECHSGWTLKDLVKKLIYLCGCLLKGRPYLIINTQYSIQPIYLKNFQHLCKLCIIILPTFELAFRLAIDYYD